MKKIVCTRFNDCPSLLWKLILTFTLFMGWHTSFAQTDDCASATLITIGANISGSTAGLTAEGSGCGANASPDVWFRIVGNGNNFTASLCNPGTIYDTRLDIFSGSSCALISFVGCDDDFCGISSQVSWNSISGTNYYIRVGGFGNASGNYQITLSQIIIIVAKNLTTDVSFPTLQAAIDAASDGDQIQLLDNITTALNISKSVTINSNGFLLTIDGAGLEIPTGKTLNWPSTTLSVNSGSTIINNGTLWNNGIINYSNTVAFSNNGLYKGSGSFNGPIINNGTISPGN
jgi:hypothetical protein